MSVAVGEAPLQFSVTALAGGHAGGNNYHSAKGYPFFHFRFVFGAQKYIF
jgi:hypothetical protein